MPRMLSWRWGALPVIALLWTWTSAGAQPPVAAPSFAATPLEVIAAGNHPWLTRGDLRDVRSSLRDFYSRRGDTPCWSSGSALTPVARAWLAALAGLETYGLPPSEVDAPALVDSAGLLDTGDASPEAFAAFDVAMSAAVARTLRALHGERVRPERVDSSLIVLHAPIPVAAMLDSIVVGGEPRDWLERVQPSFPAYQRLLMALARYREADADSNRALPEQPPRLRADRPSRAVARLRSALALSGDVTRVPAGTRADSVSDARLVAGIGRLQRRHHLPVTGRLDTTTWALARGAVSERIAEMRRTLEHWRWLPRDLGAPLLLVNIPAFRLEAIERLDQPDSTRLRINVVIGTAYKTQTPVLTAALTSVDFMPDWDVPPTIGVREVQPQALADSTYLRKSHMELISGGRIVPPTPSNIAAIGHGVRVRQQPGPENPLGRIKFVIPNRFDVYLHDTPTRYLFDRRQRDFSHGCIRVGDAPALARWVLRERPDWPAARIDSALGGLTTLKVRLPRPILVAIVYATAEAMADGSVRFHPDVYGHDRALELLLAGATPDSVTAERLRGFEARHGRPASAVAPAPPPSETPVAPAVLPLPRPGVPGITPPPMRADGDVPR